MITLNHTSPSGEQVNEFMEVSKLISHGATCLADPNVRSSDPERDLCDEVAWNGEVIQHLADALRVIALGARDPESVALAALHCLSIKGETATDLLSPTWEFWR
jgi:hypothetical protein